MIKFTVINVKRKSKIQIQNIQINNSLYRIAAKCPICKTNKTKLIKKPEDVIKTIIIEKLNKKETVIKATQIHAPV